MPFAELQRQPPAQNHGHTEAVAGGVESFHQRRRVDLGADRAEAGDDFDPGVETGGEEMIHRGAGHFTIRGEVGRVGDTAAGKEPLAEGGLEAVWAVHVSLSGYPDHAGAWRKQFDFRSA